MAIRIKLGDYQTVTGDPLGRTCIGYFPRMTEAEAWEAGRGVWKMNRTRAARERFALVVGQGTVLVVAEITGATTHEDRIALTGDLLTSGHPLYNRYITAADPLANSSQNSITYGPIPGEAEFRTRPCACDCGQTTEGDFVPGHELRAIQARVRKHFGGNVLSFITWLDKTCRSPTGGPADARTPQTSRPI